MHTIREWNRAMVIICRPGNPGIVRENVKDLVAMFINDYLAVNPMGPQTRRATEKDSK